MRVISASRRTDIPAWYTPWLLNRLRAGYCHVANPFGGQISRVSLRTEDVLALVFWTRNPAPLLPHLEALRAAGYRCYVHMTITGYPRVLEPAAPPVGEAVATLRRLSAAIGPANVIWRYDPILISALTTPETHLQRFTSLAANLAGVVEQCIISYTQFYQKTTRNLNAVPELCWMDPDADQRIRLAVLLADIAAIFNIRLAACCSPELLSERISPAHCVDPAHLRRLRPDVAVTLSTTPSRAHCGCAASTDIGAYDTCRHGCAYCYATSHPAIAHRRYAEHDPEDSILWRPLRLRGVDLDAHFSTA